MESCGAPAWRASPPTCRRSAPAFRRLPKSSSGCRASASSARRAWIESGGDRVRVQRVEMFVCPSATPADTTELQKLADSGKIKPDTLVALVGKTEGTGAHDDWGRVWADVALREWTAKFLSIPVDEVAKQVIFVLSGGCPGVITPHIAAVTREWVEVADERPGAEKRLVVGRAGSEAGNDMARWSSSAIRPRRKARSRSDMR